MADEPTLFFTVMCTSSPEPTFEKPCGTMAHASIPIDDKVITEFEDAGWLMPHVRQPDGKIIVMPTCPACRDARGIDAEMAKALADQRRREA